MNWACASLIKRLVCLARRSRGHRASAKGVSGKPALNHGGIECNVTKTELGELVGELGRWSNPDRTVRPVAAGPER